MYNYISRKILPHVGIYLPLHKDKYNTALSLIQVLIGICVYVMTKIAQSQVASSLVQWEGAVLDLESLKTRHICFNFMSCPAQRQLISAKRSEVILV